MPLGFISGRWDALILSKTEGTVAFTATVPSVLFYSIFMEIQAPLSKSSIQCGLRGGDVVVSERESLPYIGVRNQLSNVLKAVPASAASVGAEGAYRTTSWGSRGKPCRIPPGFLRWPPVLDELRRCLRTAPHQWSHCNRWGIDPPSK